MKKEINLVKNELKRAEEFARLADNGIVANALIDDIRDTYGLFVYENICEEDYIYE